MQSGSYDFVSESEFENVSEQTLTEDEEVSILIILTRLRRILNWNSSINEHDERMFNREYGSQIIREILSQFYEWKEFLTRSDLEDRERRKHTILFSLARLALLYWITDSRLVEEIIREVYECDGHFSAMFAHVVNRHDARSLLRHMPEYMRQREDSITVFFLHHTYKTRLEFRGVRFIDVRLRFPLNISPVLLAAIYHKPNILLHLLRYGARIDRSPDRMIFDDWTLPMALRHLIRILWNSLGEDLQFQDGTNPVMSNHMHQAAECVRIMLRVIPQIRMGEINFLLMKFENGVLSGAVWSHEFIRQLSDKDIVPTLVNRYLEPSDLRHLCRCVIRDALNTTWNLPYGIEQLPLPTIIKRYLSLSYD